jgi:hypothetical protein
MQLSSTLSRISGKTALPFFCFTLILVLGYSYSYSQKNGEKGSITSESRPVSGFTGITLDIHADVAISQDNNFEVTIEARQEILDQIITEKKGDNLVIKNKDPKWHMSGENPIRITIHMPKLNAIELNGSGNITARTDFSTDKMKLEVNGSGNVKMMGISASSFMAEINGSGNVDHVSGKINDASFAVNGPGNINAENLSGKTVRAMISGSGDISVGVSDELNVDIAGSGNVYYKGSPASIKKNIVGSGGVSQR